MTSLLLSSQLVDYSVVTLIFILTCKSRQRFLVLFNFYFGLYAYSQRNTFSVQWVGGLQVHQSKFDRKGYFVKSIFVRNWTCSFKVLYFTSCISYQSRNWRCISVICFYKELFSPYRWDYRINITVTVLLLSYHRPKIEVCFLKTVLIHLSGRVLLVRVIVYNRL